MSKDLPINQIIHGDCLEVMKGWPDGSVHCCVTSPPYWGLRSYGHWFMQSVWGTTSETMEDFCPPRKHKDRWLFRLRWRAAEKGGVYSRSKKNWIGAYGLEPSPEMYIHHTVTIFQEVKRVLRDDGTLWLNLGDSYTSGGRGGGMEGPDGEKQRSNQGALLGPKSPPPGLKHKDLCGIPWRVALALQADGWYLRQDIIWAKPNPMPESCTDRCTKAHEYLFLLTKKPRYFYDAEAIREPFADARMGNPKGGGQYVKSVHQKFYSPNAQSGLAKGNWTKGIEQGGRNKRSVWTVTTKAFSEAHFATFPPKLIEPCILAGTSAKGCCPECGGPWERVVEKEFVEERQPWINHKGPNPYVAAWNNYLGAGHNTTTTTGWRPTCDCSFEVHAVPGEGTGIATPCPVPCVVFDPFMGSGTVAMVAAQLGRNYVGTELNKEYAEMARGRAQSGETGISVKEARTGQMAMFSEVAE